jgi:hypothetical protein
VAQEGTIVTNSQEREEFMGLVWTVLAIIGLIVVLQWLF